jgi:histone deacetylase 11
MALEKGYAINLSGGYASSNSGGGFCVYADITLCADHLLKYHVETVKRIMVVDLDAH